jgi:hypothetical protein
VKSVMVSLVLGAGALVASAANAGPLSTEPVLMPHSDIENVRLVCDDAGRCYRTGGGRRVVVQEYGDSYNYVPRERYIERRGYYGGSGYYNDGPSVGIGVGPGGVGVGVGVGPRW